MNLPCDNIRLCASNIKIMSGTTPLVDGVNFEVNAGEILAIIGPNGAGKSSLLNALSGDIDYSGTLTLNDIQQHSMARARQLAVLPQFSLLNFPYLVSEVVALGRTPHKTGWQKDQEIVHQALDLFDISYLAERKYTQLSGGEKQRVQLARVFSQIWRAKDAHKEARILLLDEPTTALDLGHQQQLLEALRVFAKQEVAIVMVMHDINLAACCADKILAMACGQQVRLGSPQDVITTETMQQLFNAKVSIVSHPDRQTPIMLGH